MLKTLFLVILGILLRSPSITPKPSEDFVKLTVQPYYVDKTELLHLISEFHNNYDFVACPHRFLKTSNLQMIKSFYQFEFDSNGQVKNYTDTETYSFFKNFKISNYSETFLKNRMANHPVLFIDLKFNIDEIKTFAHVDSLLNIKLRSAFEEYFPVLAKQPTPTGEFEMTKFESDFIQKLKDGSANQFDLSYGLYRLNQVLFKYFKRRVIVLVDNYDYAAEQAILRNDQVLDTDGAVHYFYSSINNMFRKTFKKNRNTKNYAMITGISGRIEYADDEVTENRFLDDHLFSPYFAFTEDEVDQLLIRYDCLCSEIGFARNYYSGYHTRLNNNSLYSPYSIVQYVLNGKAADQKAKLRPYWAESENHEFIKQALKNVNFFKKLRQMIDDCSQRVNISIYERSSPALDTFVRTINEKRATFKGIHQLDDTYLFHHLLEIGFLSNSNEKDAFCFPNEEIREILKKIVDEYEKANPQEKT